MPEDSPLTRRKVLQTTGFAAGIGILGTGTATLSQGETTSEASTTTIDATTDWPQFQGNPAKTGVAGGGPSSPSVRWEYGSDTKASYSQPAIKDETLYVPYTNESDGESDTQESGVVALTTDGREQWRFSGGTEIGISSAPAVADGLVFVGGKSFGRDECAEYDAESGLLLALDAETGEEVYRRTIRGMSAKAPSVGDGNVYTVVPSEDQDDGILVAFETTSGTEQWRVDTAPYGMEVFTTPPVSVADGRVYVAMDDAVARDASTGEEVWRTPTNNLKGKTTNAPAVVGGTVYVGTGGERGTFYALSADDGSIEWERDAESDRFSSAAVTDDTVYVSMQTIDSPPEGVLALSTDDGSKKWLSEDVSVLESPIRGEEYVYVGREALSPEDGSIAWSLDGENAGTAVASETLYLGGQSVLAVGEE